MGQNEARSLVQFEDIFLTACQSLRRRTLREVAIFCSRSILFWIDPIMALWLWVLPRWIANAFVINSGMYVQHSGCVAKTPCGAGKALHRICVELFQSHDVQHGFSSGAPRESQGPLVRNTGTSSTPQAGVRSRGSACGSLWELPCSLSTRGGRGSPKTIRRAGPEIHKQLITLPF